jgi:hypothetical protein
VREGTGGKSLSTGNSTCREVPWAGGLVTVIVPPECFDPVGEAGAAGGVGTADAVVVD